MTQPTVFIIDDDDAVRDSLAQLVGTMDLGAECYESAEAFLAGFDADRSGCLILDVEMPGMGGIELQDWLIERGIQLPVIMITGHGDIAMCVNAIRKGALDFLEKPFRPQQLRERIRTAIRIDGDRRRKKAAQNDIDARFADLTEEERAVLVGIFEGKQNKIIAAELDVSLRTLQFRRASLMRKLNVESRAALLRLVCGASGAGIPK